MMKTVTSLMLAVCLVGCAPPPSPTFVEGSTNYATILFDGNSVMHQSGTLHLYYFPDGSNGRKLLLWSYVVSGRRVAFDNVVLFNGGLCNSDRRWSVRPAILGYAGTGKVVELTAPLTRILEQQSPGWPNCIFMFKSITETNISFRAIKEMGTIDFEVAKTDLVDAILTAQTNGQPSDCDGIPYMIAR